MILEKNLMCKSLSVNDFKKSFQNVWRFQKKVVTLVYIQIDKDISTHTLYILLI